MGLVTNVFSCITGMAKWIQGVQVGRRSALNITVSRRILVHGDYSDVKGDFALGDSGRMHITGEES